MKIKIKQILDLYCKVTCKGICKFNKACFGRINFKIALEDYKKIAKTTPELPVSVYGTSCIAWDNVSGKYNLAYCSQCSVRQSCIYHSHPELCKLKIMSK